MKQATILTKSFLQTILYGLQSTKWIKLKFAIFNFLAFDFLFYSSSHGILDIGINLILFSSILILTSFFIHPKSLNHKVYIWSALALFLSSINIFYLKTSWSFIIYFISFMSFVGSIYNIKAHNIFISFLQAVIYQVSNPLNALIKILTLSPKQVKLTKINYIFPYIILPASLVSIFAVLYSASNSILHNFLLESANNITFIYSFFKLERMVVWFLFFTFCSIFFISPSKITQLTFGGYSKHVIREELRRSTPNFPILGLTQELKISQIILISLNLLLFLTIAFEGLVFFSNSLEYTAAELSKMVHSGTYIVTFTIAISAGLVVLFFRKNLNFHPKNQLLIKLSKFWLSLNSIYVGVVACKNMMYIFEYGLTAKRMSVVIYLASCLALLFYSYLKITKKWTIEYFMNRFMAAVCVIVLSYSLVDHKGAIVYFAANIQKENIDTKYLSDLCKDRQYLLYKNMNQIESKSPKELHFYGKNHYTNHSNSWKSFNYIHNKENNFYKTEAYKNLNHTKTHFRY